MELKAESRAESGFPQGTLLPNIRSPGPTRLTVQQYSSSNMSQFEGDKGSGHHGGGGRQDDGRRVGQSMKFPRGY
jgi:hypothetical protein